MWTFVVKWLKLGWQFGVDVIDVTSMALFHLHFPQMCIFVISKIIPVLEFKIFIIFTVKLQ